MSLNGRPCTLELSKNQPSVAKHKPNACLKSQGKLKQQKPLSAPAIDNGNVENGDPHVSLPYKAEKEYYQLVYLTKADKDYGACSETKQREATDSPDSLPSSENVCKFPSGCYDNSYAFCVFRNLTTVGLSIMLINTGFLSIQALQTSVHAGYGSIATSSIYAATLVSCFIASTLMKKFQQRTILVTVALSSMLFYSSNLAPQEHLYLLIPGSCIFGLTQGLMWISMSAYVTRLANQYARRNDLDRAAVLCKFNGIVFGITSSAQIWSHLLSGVFFSALPSETAIENLISIVTQGPPKSSSPLAKHRKLINVNRTFEPDLRIIAHSYSSLDIDIPTVLIPTASDIPTYHSKHSAPKCGIEFNYTSFFNSTELSYDRPLGYREWLVFCSLCILLSLLAIILAVLLLKRLPLTECCQPTQVPLKGSFQPLHGLVSVLRDPRMQLLCPLVLYTALKQGFVMADYTQAYITCALSVNKIGLVMLCYGSVCTFGSFFVALVLQHLKRYLLVGTATCFEVGNLAVLYLWSPHRGDSELFYVVAVCMGVCDAIWQTQLNAIIGGMFADLPVSAFSLHRIIFSSGLCLAFAYSHFLYVTSKLVVMTIVLFFAVCCYCFMELRGRHLEKYAMRDTSRDFYANQIVLPRDL